MRNPTFTCPHCHRRGDSWRLDVMLHDSGMSYPARVCLGCFGAVRVYRGGLADALP